MRVGEKTMQVIDTATTGGRGKVYLKGRKYAEWIKYSTPIAERQAACADAQPDMENCSNGIAPQPNTLTEGAQKMKVPIVSQ